MQSLGSERADFRQVMHCYELLAFVEDIELGFVNQINTCICESKSRTVKNNSPYNCNRCTCVKL